MRILLWRKPVVLGILQLWMLRERQKWLRCLWQIQRNNSAVWNQASSCVRQQLSRFDAALRIGGVSIHWEKDNSPFFGRKLWCLLLKFFHLKNLPLHRIYLRSSIYESTWKIICLLYSMIKFVRDKDGPLSKCPDDLELAMGVTQLFPHRHLHNLFLKIWVTSPLNWIGKGWLPTLGLP